MSFRQHLYNFLFVGGEMTLRKRVFYLVIALALIGSLYLFAIVILIPDRFDR